MKNKVKRALAGIVSLSMLASAMAGLQITASAADDAMTAEYEQVQFSMTYDDGISWDNGAFEKSSSGTITVGMLNESHGKYGAYGSNTNDNFTLTYMPEKDITGYEVEFFATTQANLAGSNFNDSSNSIIYYSSDNSVYTKLSGGDNYNREDIIDFYNGTQGDGIHPAQENDIYKHKLTNKTKLPDGVKYFRVYSKGKNWKSAFHSIKLYGAYDGADEVSQALEAEFVFENISGGQDAGSVTEPLSLMQEVNGNAVEWTSSNSAAIDPETGTVTRSAVSADVILTAKTSYEVDGNATNATYTYNLVVPADTSIGSEVKVFTFGDENGPKADEDIFDGENLIDWTMSRVPGDESNPMFYAAEMDLGDGQTIYTLQRRRTDGQIHNNADGYITYSIPNMTSFSAQFIFGNYNGKVSAAPVFEISADGKDFTTLSTVSADGTAPSEAGQYQRVTYTGYNIPVGTNYLKINMPRPGDASTDGFKTVQLEKVKANINAILGEWSDGANVSLDYEGSDAVISWPAFESDEEFEYEILMDGMYLETVPKTQTSYTVSGIEEHTEYQFAVSAVQKNDDNTADKRSQTLISEIKKSSGDEYVFIDKFKFEETISKYAQWSAPIKYNSDNKTVLRASSGDLYAVYPIGSPISSFSVDMLIYQAKDGVPGETSFEVSVDGQSWTPIEAVRTGDNPGNYSIVPWNYKAENIQSILSGASYLRIKLGSIVNGRTEGVQLKQVSIKKASDEEMGEAAIIAEITKAMKWDTLFSADADALMENLTLPGLVNDTYPVTWKSSDESVITNAGVINRSETEKSAVLTATVTYASEKTLEFKYDITVLRAGVDNVIFDTCADFSKTFEHSENVVVRDMTTDFGESSAFGISNKSLTQPEKEYVIYKADNITAFDISVAENDQGDVGLMRFEIADSSGKFRPLNNVTKTTPEVISNQWKSAHYIASDLPEDTQYIKMYFVTYVLSPTNKCWSFVIRDVTLMQKDVEYTYEWPENSELTVSDVTENSANLSWPAAVAAEGEVEYDVYADNDLKATVSQTNATITGLDRNTVYSVYVRAKGTDDESKISIKLAADDFRTRRKQGTASSITPESSSVELSNVSGDVVSASADVTITDAAVFENNGHITLGFKQSDGTLGNAYVNIYEYTTEFYKNGKVTEVLEHDKYETGDTVNVVTEDCWITEAGQTLFVEGADWSNVVLYSTPESDDVYYTNASIDTASEVRVDLVPENMPLENLSRSFTFETNITIPETNEQNLRIALYSDKDNMKVVELTQEKDFEHGKKGALYLTYENTGLYEARTWLPRLEYDGKTRNLKLFVDMAADTVIVAIDNKVVAEDIYVSNIDAPHLSYMVLSGGYTLTDTVISGGYKGFAYKPAYLADNSGNPIKSLKSGETATARFSVVNSGPAKNVQMYVKQDDASTGIISKINASEEQTIQNKEGWQNIDLDITATSDNGHIKAYVWDDSLSPIAEAGGYYGETASKNTDKRLFLIGDSTVRYVYKTGQNPPNIGWGEVIDRFLNDDIEVYNYAKDGTSSKTYWQSGRFNAMKPYMREGDYLMFQLAHNDRSTTPGKGTTTEEYKSYLEKFVAEARRMGLNMIFVTPVALQADITEGDAAKDPSKSSLYQYVQAMEEVAAEYDVPIIDLFRTSITNLHEAGVTSSDKKGIYTDGTHFTEAGAEILCGYIKTLLQNCEETDLGNYFN